MVLLASQEAKVKQRSCDHRELESTQNYNLTTQVSRSTTRMLIDWQLHIDNLAGIHSLLGLFQKLSSGGAADTFLSGGGGAGCFVDNVSEGWRVEG